MQTPKEKQGEITKPSLAINAKKYREKNRIGKTRDLFKKIEKPRKHFMQRWAQ